MIVLWGVATDGPLAAVRKAVDRQQSAHVFLDQWALDETKIEVWPDHPRGAVLNVGGTVVNLDQVSAIYLRPDAWEKVPAFSLAGPGSPLALRALAVQDILLGWAETTAALVINRPSAMASNHSKPYQLSLIKAAGIAVPDTLVTTDAAAVLEFKERHGTLIYKSVSGVRSIVCKFDERHLARLGDVSACPTQFQQFIEGTDYRVHVVGDELFACAIRCEAIDYRYAEPGGVGLDIRPADLPSDIAVRCYQLARSLKLSLCGIDLRRDPSGLWYCFEVNPSPAFTFYQRWSKQPIAEAVGALLATRSPAPRRSGVT